MWDNQPRWGEILRGVRCSPHALLSRLWDVGPGWQEVLQRMRHRSHCPAANPSVPSPKSPVSSPFVRTPDSGPIFYTPSHLASRILSGKTTLEGERKIVTVL